MNIYEIINTLILSLSIATILITLVAFILYQIKRLNQTHKGETHGVKLESVFFRRYSPKRQKIVEQWESEKRERSNKKLKSIPSSFLKIGILFAIITSILAITLVFGKQGKRALDTAALTKRGQKIGRLQKEGLLERKIFLPPTANIYDLKSNAIIKKESTEILSYIKEKNIILLTDKTLRKDSYSKHLKALNGWTQFFRKHKIPFEVTNNIDKYNPTKPNTKKGGDLFIFPQFTTLNMNQKKEIEQLKGKVALIFTGPVNTKNPKDRWFETNFGISFYTNSNPDSYFPSQFVGSSEHLFLIPPGQVIPLVNTDNRFYSFSSKSNTSIAFESDNMGRPHLIESKEIVKASYNQNFLWSAWDPLPKKGQSNQQNHEIEYIYLQSLAQAIGKPSVRLSWWPDHTNHTTVLSVDVEDQFDNISDIIDIFAHHKVPSTLFLVAELFEKHTDKIKSYSPDLELASHGDNHDNFRGQSGLKQFNRIQTSRYIIEELTEEKVFGFRPPYEGMDSNTLAALESNGLNYIFAGQLCQRLSPCVLKNGPVVFPRLVDDDFALAKDRTLVSPERIFRSMAQDVDYSFSLGGGYFLSLHTQIFGKKPYLETIDKLISHLKMRKTKFYNFNQLAKWWKFRSVVEVNLFKLSQNQFKIQVKNNSDKHIKGVPILVHLNQLSLRTPAAESSIECKTTKKVHKCLIQEISPEQQIEIEIDI